MEKFQILFISIAFPPKNDPECIQTARFFKYLSRENDFVIDVVTSADPTLFMPVDQSLKSLDTGYRQRISIPVYETKLTNFLLRKLGLASVMFPDSKMTFHWQYQRVLRKLKNKPELLYSRSNPISSAFMAAALKRKLNIPWVMHFSDPWALSPLEEKTKRKLAQERILIDNADHITFTTDGTRQLYAKHYPESAAKFSVVPNVYDELEVSSDVNTIPDKFTIVYTGGLAGKRSLVFLDDVLRNIQRTDVAALDKLMIKVAGPMDRQNAAYFEQTPFTCVQHLGMLSYERARELQQLADVLLVADNPTDAQGAIFFPSKLLDYFMTGRTILAITPEHSTTRKVLKDYSAVCFTSSDIEGIANYLKGEIKRWTRGEKVPRVMPPRQYAAKENAALVANLFRNTLV